MNPLPTQLPTPAQKVKSVSLPPEASLRQAMEVIDHSGLGIACITSETGKLLGVLTDGDVRRALLQERPMSDPVHSFMVSSPLYGSEQARHTELLTIMQNHSVRQLPIIDNKGILKNIVLLREVVSGPVLPNLAVIMAGGKGSRLYPLTRKIPKPLLSIGEAPLLTHILHRLHRSGFRKVAITTHYLASSIEKEIGDGSRFGLDVSLICEPTPLGTAGGLSLLSPVPKEPILLMNGDILTDLDLSGLIEFHANSKAALTIALRRHDYTIPYGMVDMDGERVKKVREKPVLSFLVNAGIYIINPEVLDRIPQNTPYKATDLVDSLLADDIPIVGYPIRESWYDIGAKRDLDAAREYYDQHQ